ncbi:DNA-3-methyladenine glycosylase I [Bacillus sp. B1-b2]|uniref:DNA-3-methyladenine glycosylase I n=1 Tax=Bacillus sp. B1-b2 TaxID=2653201 RepID=UPI00126235D5|nr:DNA-3-methyladenine glycosylase I [Bacillus sp. B1-b2]
METICSWATSNELMREYHNKEWCIPNDDDRYLFEMLVLEGAQAGLSWSIILKKRQAYKQAFNNFNLDYCANLTEEEMENIRDNTEVVKHLLKIQSVKKNALAVKNVQSEFGSFANYLWGFVEGKPVVSNWTNVSQMPAESELSRIVSKDLKRRGFKFVGPVTIHSYLQAIGIVDDHIITCPYHTNNR